MKTLKEFLVPTLTLFVICLVATALLGLTNNVTAPIIEQLAIETEVKSRQVVFADAKSFGEAEILDDGTSVVAALDDAGNVIGHVFGITVSKDQAGENSIDAITGATITSRAVTDAVNAAIEAAGGADNG